MGARHLALAGVAWLATLGVGRGVVVLPEQCRPVDLGDVRAAAESAVGWFGANQLDDGRWVYRYDREAEAHDRRPHLVRHAGVTMSLYQADAAGVDGALEVADRGADWAIAQLVDAGDGRALQYDGVVPTGGSALLTAGLAVRKAATGDDRYDAELTDLGTFLASMVEPSGAVLANWDPTTDAAVPGRYSTFYTGEALWALSMLATIDPDGGWDEPAQRIAHYAATERADAEDLFPSLSDHWAAYGISQLAVGAGVDLGPEERAYARRLAQVFGLQVRFESQRTGDGLNEAVLRGGQVLGAGLGTLGEGLGALYRLDPGAGHPGRAVLSGDARDAVAERMTCVASMLVERQATSGEASSGRHPDAVAGAWFLGGVTQMDDQQHALSALLLSEPAIERGFDVGRSSDDPSVSRVLWLALVTIAVLNPLRARAAVTAVGRRDQLVGAGVALAMFVGVAVAARPLLRTIDVSPSTAMVAAGLVAAITGAVDLVRRLPGPAPVERPNAIVPVAFPALLRPAPAAVVLGVGASAGAGAGVVVAVVVAIAAGAAMVAGGDRSLRGSVAGEGSARLVAALAIVGAVDLVAHGVFSV